MAPRKKAAAKAKAEPPADATKPTTEVTATETAEPPKDAAQPATGDLAASTSKEEDSDLKDAPHDDDNTKDETEPAPPAPKATPKSRKRKQAAEPESSSKSSRRSGRSSRPELPQQQLLNYLLSKDAAEVLRPDDEKKALQERGDIRTYSSSALSPFEELMCAMILARPISHMLGLRSIRTVLNEPYNFSNARTVKEAGEEKRLQALVDARTQHKGKTADQLGQAAEVILAQFASDKDGSDLKKALSNNDNNVDKALKSLKDSINGLGDKGLDIFLRRVQWLPDWKESYPYADGLSMDGLRNIGLTQDVDELVEAIETHWGRLDTKHLAGDDAATKKRRALVVILERATGAHLGNKIHELQQAAAGA